ncbi:cytochrome b [Segnochrobactrum spirostomi]|uniref:Cytochrome b n=1 Tax=Segnochrobactrum spirostomi TaxID=2608987 RepID=A0A6A7Y8M6_9HYPH|nr:cytochrome b [Segnochrobactrum spirostomi]MQT14328.1 cytochrome b [Segnochrobactrum spirostomi]
MAGHAYSITQRIFHWGMFLLFAVQFGVVWSIPDGGGDAYASYWQLHYSLGVVILIAGVARLIIRVAKGVPALPADMPRWQVAAARLNEAALYVIMIGMPILGWIAADTRGRSVTLFGLPLPAFVGPQERGTFLRSITGDAHELLGTVLLILVGLHVLGALYHGFIRRDGVLQSMTSGR